MLPPQTNHGVIFTPTNQNSLLQKPQIGPGKFKLLSNVFGGQKLNSYNRKAGKLGSGHSEKKANWIETQTGHLGGHLGTEGQSCHL